MKLWGGRFHPCTKLDRAAWSPDPGHSQFPDGFIVRRRSLCGRFWSCRTKRSTFADISWLTGLLVFCLHIEVVGDSKLVTWGGNSKVPAGLTNVVAIAAGGNQSMALKDDGAVVTWFNSSTNATAGPTNIVAIAKG